MSTIQQCDGLDKTYALNCQKIQKKSVAKVIHLAYN